MSDEALKGVKIAGVNDDGVTVHAPADDAPDDQWLDFARVLGAGAYEFNCMNSSADVQASVRDWSRKIAEAYIRKWGESEDDEGHVILTSAPGADQ